MGYCSNSCEPNQSRWGLGSLAALNSLDTALVASVVIHVCALVIVGISLQDELKSRRSGDFVQSSSFSVTIKEAVSKPVLQPLLVSERQAPVPDVIHVAPAAQEPVASVEGPTQYVEPVRRRSLWSFGGSGAFPAVQAAYQAQHMREIANSLTLQNQLACEQASRQDCKLELSQQEQN